MVTGIEIVAAVWGIVSGITTCSKYAKDYYERNKRRQINSNVLSSAEALLKSLDGSQLQLGNELGKLKRLERVHGKSRTSSDSRLLEAQSSVDSLQSILSQVSSHSDLSTVDFTRYQNLTVRSTNLTLECLQQTIARLQGGGSTSLIRLSPTPSFMSILSRTQLNPHRICANAIAYRKDYSSFREMTTTIPHKEDQEWRCDHSSCATSVFKIALTLQTPQRSSIWIMAHGVFKAHCERAGWTCIWHIVHGDCRTRFGTLQDLLLHMREHHVKVGTNARTTRIHGSPDLQSLVRPSALSCGFGAIIDGHDVSDDNYIFPDR